MGQDDGFRCGGDGNGAVQHGALPADGRGGTRAPDESADDSGFPVELDVPLRLPAAFAVRQTCGRQAVCGVFRANGKALLSTNDWVQVFFEEDGYLLVQYAISRHQYRIGYIKADAVSNLSEVAEIGSWANYPAQVLRTSVLTDDPLNSCGAVMTLTAGQQVTYLGQLGQEWAFVETTTAQGQRIRGFVELSDLNVTRPDDADDNLNG